MKYLHFLSAMALPGLVAAPAMGAEPLVSNAKWVVDFGKAHCIATRNYGTAAAPIFLAFKPSPIGDVMQVSVLRGSGKKGIDQYDGTIAAGEAPPLRVSMLGYPGKSGKMRIVSINLSLDDFKPVRTASVLRFRSAGELNRAFALTQMAPVAAALDDCVAGLRTAWHIGDEKGELSQPARSQKPLRDYFGSNDYPAVAVYGLASGTVGMVTLIDEAGKLESCMVTQTSGNASLDAQSCAIVTERAKFDPALGSDGKPAKSGTTLRIRWQLGN